MPATYLADAADVVRDLADWLVQRRLVDDDVAEHLGRYTHLYDGDQRTGTGPEALSPDPPLGRR